MMGATGSEQEKLAIIDGILEKATAACRGLAPSPQFDLATNVMSGLREAFVSCRFSDVYDISPLSASVMEDGKDAGTLVIEWATNDARACIFVDEEPSDSQIVLIHGVRGESGEGVPSVESVMLGLADVPDMTAKVVGFIMGCMSEGE